MAIINLFSKRQKQMRGEVSDVFIYDVLPENLKVQIIYIIEDIFGTLKPIEYTQLMINVEENYKKDGN